MVAYLHWGAVQSQARCRTGRLRDIPFGLLLHAHMGTDATARMLDLSALLQTFPDIDEMYRQRTLTRLIEKEQWAVAATYAGQHMQCQVTNIISHACCNWSSHSQRQTQWHQWFH
ncbi:hypothetical protein ABBQ32_001184 [Trebouxia sp. C0010 RCD-2024]